MSQAYRQHVLEPGADPDVWRCTYCHNDLSEYLRYPEEKLDTDVLIAKQVVEILQHLGPQTPQQLASLCETTGKDIGQVVGRIATYPIEGTGFEAIREGRRWRLLGT